MEAQKDAVANVLDALPPAKSILVVLSALVKVAVPVCPPPDAVHTVSCPDAHRGHRLPLVKPERVLGAARDLVSAGLVPAVAPFDPDGQDQISVEMTSAAADPDSDCVRSPELVADEECGTLVNSAALWIHHRREDLDARGIVVRVWIHHHVAFIFSVVSNGNNFRVWVHHVLSRGRHFDVLS